MRFGLPIPVETTVGLSDWQVRHVAALRNPVGFEIPIEALLRAFLTYSAEHRRRYESPVGEDGVLSYPWADIGKSLIQLLNGETGRLDCATIARIVRAEFIANGLTDEGEDK